MLDSLTCPYSRARWSALLRQLFARFEERNVPLKLEAPAGGVAARMVQLGTVTVAGAEGEGDKSLAVVEIEASDVVNLMRNRVGLRQTAARLLSPGTADGLLVVTTQPGMQVWRFTFISREVQLEEQGQLIRTETAPRRFTYLLGPGESCRTAKERFSLLAARRPATNLTHVLEAFSVEKLNKEFFDTYRDHYRAFCDHLLAGDAPSTVFGLTLDGLEGKVRDRALKPVRDFVKKLLGRLVFLHFLQKKGWLGCDPARDDWHGGPPDFLSRLFDAAPAAEQARFHSSRLIPLFFHTLNNPSRPGDLFDVTGTRVPYLNGGLFEPDFAGVERLDFPAPLFAAVLEFFGQYHFTIDENDPEDHEIGIDPEMLGHIFENLLEDNKDKGAYYTPKAVVQYMCQQSLIHALAGRFPGDPLARGEIEKLIRIKEPIDARDSRSWLARHATELATRLDEFRICDPAIGSGAFPIGLLQEIYWTQLTLNPALDRAAAKRSIIQRSIHGVDLDAGAVEIARLRFWLALIVEESAPVPLPNLDYQIMQGNSLLESFEGERLDDLAEPVRYGVRILGSDQNEFDFAAAAQAELHDPRNAPAADLADLRGRYYACHEPEEKGRLRTEIDAAVLRAIDARFARRRDELETSLAQEATFTHGRQRSAKEQKKRDAMQAELTALDGKTATLHSLLEDPRAERPFFLWHLWFRHVLADPPDGRGGFDIVIANPPYGAEIPAADATIFRKQFETLANSLDSFIVFMEQASRLLRPCGTLSYIIPCGWVSTPSCRKLRALFARSFHPHIFASLPYDVFGEAYVDTMIVVATRLGLEENWNAIEDKSVDLVVFPVRHRIAELTDFDRFHKASDFGLWGDASENGFLVTSDFREAELVAKLRAMPRQFDHFVDVMRGIETYNPQAAPLSQCSRRALVGDIYRYQINHTGDGYIAYPPDLENGKPWRYFSGPRLLLRQLLSRKFRLQAGYTEDDFLTNQSVQSLLARDEAAAPIKVLLAVLNSKLISWYFCQINMVARRDDFPKTIIKVTRELPIPDVALRGFEDSKLKLTTLVDRILAAKRLSDEAAVAALEVEIDTHVFRLYGLTPEEIRLVQGTSPAGIAPALKSTKGAEDDSDEPPLEDSSEVSEIRRPESVNPFFLLPGELREKAPPIREGDAFYVRFTQAEENVPAPDGGERSFWLMDGFSTGWFANHPPPGEDENPWSDEEAFIRYYQQAALYLLELEIRPGQAGLRPLLEDIGRHLEHGKDPDDWYRITAGPSLLPNRPADAPPMTVFPGLFQEGVVLSLGRIETVDEAVERQLNRAVSTGHVRDATDARLSGLLSHGIDWAVVYDVGQGNCIGLCDSSGRVRTYFDFGGGAGTHAKTFSPLLKNFCFTNSPPIILSHWDHDHWSSWSRDRRALTHEWIAPRQLLTAQHTALLAHIAAAGGKAWFLPPGFSPTRFGQIHLELCNGSNRNNSGIALTLSEIANGTGRQILMPGDADYRWIGSFTGGTPYLSVVAPHHGAKLTSSTLPGHSGASPARLVYSYGQGNSYGHPHPQTRQDHDALRWRDPAYSSTPHRVRLLDNVRPALGHVLLGWKRHTSAPALSCNIPACQLAARQL